MSDLKKYIKKRKEKDKGFAVNYDAKYKEFELGTLLKQLRGEQGLTQDEFAEMLNTQKPAISRWENHGGNIQVSTLHKIVTALGKTLRIEIK